MEYNGCMSAQFFFLLVYKISTNHEFSVYHIEIDVSQIIFKVCPNIVH